MAREVVTVFVVLVPFMLVIMVIVGDCGGRAYRDVCGDCDCDEHDDSGFSGKCGDCSDFGKAGDDGESKYHNDSA